MKKYLVCLLVVVFTLTACKGKTVSEQPVEAQTIVTTEEIPMTQTVEDDLEPTKTEEVSEMTSVQETEKTSGTEEEELSEVTQEEINAAWESRLLVNKNYSDEIPTITEKDVENEVEIQKLDNLCVTIYPIIQISGESYTDLHDSVEVLIKSELEAFTKSVNGLTPEQVGENASCTFYIRQTRNDVRTLSCTLEKKIHNIEDEVNKMGYTFDSLTGKKIEFSDIIQDEPRFWNYTKEYILESMKENKSNSAAKYSSMIKEMDENSSDWIWYLNASGISIEFPRDVMESLGCDAFTIPYKKCANLFNPEYLPGDGPFEGKVSPNIETEVYPNKAFTISGEKYAQDENCYYPELIVGNYTEKLEPDENHEFVDAPYFAGATVTSGKEGKVELNLIVKGSWDSDVMSRKYNIEEKQAIKTFEEYANADLK